LKEDGSREGDDQDHIEDSSLDDQVDQYIVSPNEQHLELGHQSKLVSPSSKDVPPTSSILASSAAMSQEELEQFEKDNPFDAFELLLRSDTLLSKIILKSSDTSTGGLSHSFKESLLAEFRNKVLDIDLFQAIEQDENIISEVKDLFLKLDQNSFDLRFRELWQMLEPFMENVKLNLHQKKADQSKLK